MPFSAPGSSPVLRSSLHRSLCALALVAAFGASRAAEPPAPPLPGAETQSVPLGTPQPAPKVVTDLSGEILYKTMLAEIAAARGQVELAAYIYVDVAQRTQDARMARRATELSLASGQTELTGKAAKLWAALEPKASNSLQALALAMSGEMGKLEDIEPPLRRMLESETTPTEVFLLQLPGLLVRYPDKAAALAMVERLTQPYLNMPEAYFVRAVMALSAGDLTKAERASQKALDLRPDWEAAARVKAQSVPKARQTQAMEELGRFGKRYPQSIGAREDYARWLASEGRKAEAAEAYERLRADFPNNDDVIFGAVVMMVQGGESEKAEPLLRRLIDHNYREVDQLRLQLGLILESSKPDEAVSVYRSVQPGAQYITARARAAQVLIGQGKTEEARAVLAEASAKSPDNAVELTLAQASLLRQNKQTAAALELLDKYLVSKPDEHEVLYQAAMLAEELKRYDVMEQRLRHLIAVRPEQSSAFNALGYSFADRNIRLEEADQLLTQAIKLSPDEAAIVDSMGWLRFRQNRLDSAAEFLRKAYKLQADPEIAAHLGEVLWKQGRQDESRQVLQQARKSSPDNAALIEVMERLLK
jgi:tetratricopeptide (TPR) repeat protein